MRPSRSRRGLSPFKRRVAAALLAGLPAGLAARLVDGLVPDAPEAGLLGPMLFALGVQAVVLALFYPLAEDALPAAEPPGCDAAGDEEGE